MAKLDLNLASRFAASGKAKDISLEQAQLLIESLPAFNPPLRLTGLVHLATDINRSTAAPAKRTELLNTVDQELGELLSFYQGKALHYTFPLPAPAHQLHNDIQALLAEMVSGYKRLIMDLLAERESTRRSGALRNAIERCIEYIARQVLLSCAVYRDVPAGIWRDLHKLYAYTEQCHVEGDDESAGADISLRGAYVRVLLLSIANPRHLLLGEIFQANELLKKWAMAVRLEPVTDMESVYGRFFCDLAGDQPPTFGVADVTVAPTEPRLLVLDELLAIINKRMKQLALQHQRSMQLRAEWDLLLRLRTAWESRKVRGDVRQPERGITVKAIVGLSSSHYFFSGYSPFEPEQQEIDLHGGDFKQETALSLVPSDETPWTDADVQNKLKSGVIKPRAFGFDLEDREHDIWKKAHESGPRRETELEKSLDQRSLGQIFKFSLVNTSDGGVGLETPTDTLAQLRVGELVAAFQHDDGDPVLNVVRWIHCESDRKMYIGLRHINGDTAAVAVRSLEENTRFQSYARGFVVTDDSGNPSVIVPAGLFSNGNTILLNHGDRLQTVQLKMLLQNTRALAQFTFKQVPAEAQWSETIISSLKQLLRENAR